MKPLSNDLRQRILKAVDGREGSRRQLAARFSVDPSTITRWLQLRRESGACDPRTHAGGTKPTLDPEALERLRKLVEETPDATLEQLRQGLGISGGIMIVWRGLKKLGITRKKTTLHAAEQDRPEVQEERRSFRRGGRADRAQTACFRGRDRGHDGDDARLRPGSEGRASGGVGPGVVGVGDGDRGDGPGRGPRPVGVSGRHHAGGVSDLRGTGVVPALREGDVVIFDNLAAHLGPEVTKAIERAGASVLPLPRYSPDFNPIEEMFSKFKEALRRLGARAKDHLYDAIGEALREVTLEDILGWFRQAGSVCNASVNRSRVQSSLIFFGRTTSCGG